MQVNGRRVSQESRVNGEDATEQNDKCISVKNNNNGLEVFVS